MSLKSIVGKVHNTVGVGGGGAYLRNRKILFYILNVNELNDLQFLRTHLYKYTLFCISLFHTHPHSSE